ncbi:MAG TPA: hypothetical protein VFV02_04960 [Acidimicrobiales bacterium]|nr:hypothetical protein [Acidimicrobiales bacterium]
MSPSQSPEVIAPRRPTTVVLTSVLVLLVLVLAACGGGSSTATSARPHTDAKLFIVSPSPNQVTGPNVPVQFDVQGAIVSPPQKNKLAPNEGHIHVTVDGRLVSMSYGTSTEVYGLGPGMHTLQAEFVANDHLPFADRVLTVVLFTVQS